MAGKHRIWLHYYGRWYLATVDRIVGKGAWVTFVTSGKHGDVKTRWVRPGRNGIRLREPWRSDAARRWTDADDFRDMVERGLHVPDDDGFEPRALAATVEWEQRLNLGGGR